MDPSPLSQIYQPMLMRLVAMIVSVVGRDGDVTVHRQVRTRLYWLLRPAESAVRRIVLTLALDMLLAGLQPTPRPRRAGPNGSVPAGPGGTKRVPGFRLFDPRKVFAEITAALVRVGVRIEPRVSFFDGYDPYPPRKERPDPKQRSAPRPDDPMDAKSLRGRVLALERALGDLNKQAKRLLQKRARDVTAFAMKGPIRPGSPPGWRKRATHPVDDVLRNCHLIALRARDAFDTS